MTGLWVWFVGQVWPNLVASGICTGIVWWRARVHLSRHRTAAEERHVALLAGHNDLMDSHNRLLSFLAQPPGPGGPS